jgi:hypothetical protein
MYNLTCLFCAELKLACHTKGGRKIEVFVDKVLSRIFVPKKEGLKGHWKMLYNEEPYNLLLV